MAALEDVVVSSSTGVDGNSYTTTISNDKLTNDDFLTLLLEEMKMQDPTEPTDSDALLDSQLQMSTIEANEDMSNALNKLTASYESSSLSNAVGFMGKTIEDGSYNEETGMTSSYLVQTVESVDGEVYVNAAEQTGYYHSIRTVEEIDGETVYTNITYDTNGNIKDADGNGTDINVALNEDGSFQIVDDKYVFTDNDGNEITDEDILNKYEITGKLPQYSDTTTKISVNNISKVYG